MKIALCSVAAVAIGGGAGVLFRPIPPNPAAADAPVQSTVHFRLVDASTGKPTPAMVCLRNLDDDTVRLPPDGRRLKAVGKTSAFYAGVAYDARDPAWIGPVPRRHGEHRAGVRRQVRSPGGRHPGTPGARQDVLRQAPRRHARRPRVTDRRNGSAIPTSSRQKHSRRRGTSGNVRCFAFPALFLSVDRRPSDRSQCNGLPFAPGIRKQETTAGVVMKGRIAISILAAGLMGLWGSDAGAGQKPLKVFILAGQSNMQGHARVSTFGPMRLDPKTAPILQEMRNRDGSPRVCEKVWISSIGSAEEEQVGKLTAGFGARAGGPKIGPEFTFGIYMEKLLDEPILIIKTAWGGKSLHTDFRPPSAGPYEFNDAQVKQLEKQGKDIEKARADKAKATGRYYRLMVDHVKKVLADVKRVYPDYDPERGHELAGFVWFQGWNDMVDRGTYPGRGEPGGYDKYSELLGKFIRDVRKDLSAPKLPFVIGVMGVGGPVEEYSPQQQRYKAVHRNFRMAMAAPASWPEFRGNVAAVLTEKYWDMEVVKLRAREQKIKPKVAEINEEMKTGKLARKEGQAALDTLYSETFGPREMEILKKSTSNAEYHYMGSAKVVAQIGKGFAEAMVQLLKAGRDA